MALTSAQRTAFETAKSNVDAYQTALTAAADANVAFKAAIESGDAAAARAAQTAASRAGVAAVNLSSGAHSSVEKAISIIPTDQGGFDAEIGSALLTLKQANNNLVAFDSIASSSADTYMALKDSRKAAFEGAPPPVTPQDTIKTPDATNPSTTATATAAKNADSTNVTPAPSALPPAPTTPAVSSTVAASPASNPAPAKPSAVAPKITPATPTFAGGKDHRVRLKVPTTYLVGQAAGPNNTLVKSQGIIFPYTPTLGQEYSATYNSVPLVHTNYTQYFYKNSSVSTISLSAKFTVQNDYEAEMYFSIIHLLRALTKMRWGDDDNAGSPPPVCRLFAYGDAIMNNVPVAISSVKIDFPDNVDYFTSKSLSAAPVLSTIGLTLTPIYSRNEMQKFTVSDYLSSGIRSKGYL